MQIDLSKISSFQKMFLNDNHEDFITSLKVKYGKCNAVKPRLDSFDLSLLLRFKKIVMSITFNIDYAVVYVATNSKVVISNKKYQYNKYDSFEELKQEILNEIINNVDPV